MINQNCIPVEPMHPADIKAALEKQGVTQRSIADELDISDVSVNNVINGKATSQRIAKLIAAKIGKQVDDIWPGRYRESA